MAQMHSDRWPYVEHSSLGLSVLNSGVHQEVIKEGGQGESGWFLKVKLYLSRSFSCILHTFEEGVIYLNWIFHLV